MPMPTHIRRLYAAAVLGLACVSVAPALRAQPADDDKPRKELSAAASAGFAKIQSLLEAKDYAGALALVERQLAGARSRSYEAYVLLQAQAQILLMQNRLVEAIAPLERARALAEGNANFYEEAAALDRLYLLSQLHYQDGTERKTPAEQRAAYNKALRHVRRWLATAPRPSAEARSLAASLLYNIAILDPAKIDRARLREAITHAREALILSAAKPAGQTRLLLVACHLQLGEHALAAEQLEALAAAEPDSVSTWSQLLGIYLAETESAADPGAARAAGIRALLALERAQARGLLVSPKDHYTKVAILFRLGQHTRAAETLERGLSDGTIENTRRNWELLASAYRQAAREDLALDALGRAVEKFPSDGGLEFSLAQSLYAAGRVEDAYARGRSALAKSGVDQPGQARLYLAYLAYELERHEEARDWVAQARAEGGVSESSVEPLERAINEAIARREMAGNT